MTAQKSPNSTDPFRSVRRTERVLQVLLVLLLAAMAVAAVAIAKSLPEMVNIGGSAAGNDGGRAIGNGSGKLSGNISMTAQLVQDKILAGGDGRFSVEMTLTADGIPPVPMTGRPDPVDMVIVLDRSGSMAGQKMADARSAALELLRSLRPWDRLGVVSYANGVRMDAPLMSVSGENRSGLESVIRKIRTGGGTNLGGGLEAGIRMLDRSAEIPDDGPAGQTFRRGRLLLLSDGLANDGVTDPEKLARMAAAATRHRATVSTAGVGDDFNETLMTALADRGEGSYHYLRDPARLAGVFLEELRMARLAAAENLEIHISLPAGARLLSAGGYPVRMEGNTAVFRPGTLHAGDKRVLHLNFHVPPRAGLSYTLAHIRAVFTPPGRADGEIRELTVDTPLTVVCEKDGTAVFSSIKKDLWEKNVVSNEFGKLKEDVAQAIREGHKPAALKKIREYESRQKAVNAVVQSDIVSRNLGVAVPELRATVEESFSGPAAAEKRKQEAKALQYDAYKSRRAK